MSTRGIFTTQKLQALIELGVRPDIRSRRDLVAALARAGEKISISGVEAWFKQFDSNYKLPRSSLEPDVKTFAIPPGRWPVLLNLFELTVDMLQQDDLEFRQTCLRLAQAHSNPGRSLRLSESANYSQIGSRADEHKIVVDAFNGDVLGARPRSLFFEGAAGVGKTTLQDSFYAMFGDISCIRIRARCIEDNDVPLLPIIDLVRAVSLYNQYDAGIGSTTGSSGEKIPTTFIQLSERFSELCTRQPVVAFVDDLHWADDASIRFLEHMCDQMRVAPLRLLLIGMHRPCASGHRWSATLARLGAHPCVKFASLEQHDLAQTRELIHATSRQMPTARLTTYIWNVSRGNALFTLEIYKTLLMQNMLVISNGVSDVQAGMQNLRLPPSVNDLFLDAIDKLMNPTRDALLCLSAMNVNVDISRLHATLSSRTVDSLVDSIEEAERAGLLKFSDDQIQFRHPVIRQVVYSSAGELKRSRMHWRIAQALQVMASAASPIDTIEVAVHMVKGRAFADRTQLTLCCANAAIAAVGVASWDQAIMFASEALNAPPSNGLGEDKRAALLTILGSSHHQSGNPAEALAYLERAAESHDAAGAQLAYCRTLNEIARIRGNYGLVSSEFTGDVDQLTGLVAPIEKLDSRLASSMLSTISARHYYGRRTEAALRSALRALEVLRGQANSSERVRAEICAGLARLQQLQIAGAIAHFERAAENALQIGEAESIARAHQRLCLALLISGQIDRADVSVSNSLGFGTAIQQTGEETVALSVRLITGILRSGADDELASVHEEALSRIRKSGYFWAYARVASAYAALLCSRRQYQGASDYLLNVQTELNVPNADVLLDTLFRTRIYVAIAEQIDFKAQRFTSECYRYEAFDETPYDVTAVQFFSMDVNVAIAMEDREKLVTASKALELAHSRGVVISPGWPFFVPLVLAKANWALKNVEATRHYLSFAIEVGRTHRLAQPLRDAILFSTGTFGGDDHLTQLAMRYAASP